MAYDIERYLNIRSASGADFGPDGTLSFLMDTTGTAQLWTLDAPRVWPKQRTFYEERVTGAHWSPTRQELVFSMDEGGNERAQLFRLSGDGSDEVPLTAMPEAKHQFGGWSHDGERIAFSSNRRDDGVFDVYVQGRDEQGEAAELVYEGDGGWLSVAGWGPEDERLALVEPHASFDLDVYVLDLASGEATHLTPHDGDQRYGNVSWGPDGEYLYCTTDAGADTRYLARLDAETGARETVVEGGDWNVDGVTIDEDTRQIAYTRNVDGYTEVTVGDLDGGNVVARTTPDLPEGVAGGISFDPAGDRLAITATAPDANTNVYVVDVDSGVAEQWTMASTAGIPPESFIAPSLVHVDSFDGLSVPGFYSTPERGSPPYPVIVDIHGGPESQRRPSFRSVKQYLLANGYAVFEPNVRGSSGYGTEYASLDDVRNRMDSVADLAACVEWLQDQESVDTDRIVAYGGSYGGFMVLAALTEYPDLWAAGIDVVGIANFVTFLENTGDWRRSHREAEYGSLDDDRAFLESISPINNIDAIRAPLLVMHGENDPRVPVGEARQVADEAADHVPVDTLIFEDEGHGFSKLENRKRAYRKMVAFLDEHV
ncbi:MAG: alpha/beta fold hydrolase [Halobacteriaceae archaeon]